MAEGKLSGQVMYIITTSNTELYVWRQIYNNQNDSHVTKSLKSGRFTEWIHKKISKINRQYMQIQYMKTDLQIQTDFLFL